jgi:hypothetical protein
LKTPGYKSGDTFPLALDRQVSVDWLFLAEEGAELGLQMRPGERGVQACGAQALQQRPPVQPPGLGPLVLRHPPVVQVAQRREL